VTTVTPSTFSTNHHHTSYPKRSYHFGTPHLPSISSIEASNNSDDDNIDDDQTTTTYSSSGRRDAVSTLIQATSLLASTTTSPSIASAAGKDQGTSSVVPPKELARRLRRVPTFSIVDDTGKPFMILEGSRPPPIGYFFLNYEAAKFVLEDAIRVAVEANYENVWANAKITTVPLDFAMQLSIKKRMRKGQDGLNLESINDLIPSAADLDDASRIDKSGRYTQKGRVPMFYYEGLTLPPDEATMGNTEPRVPVYFSKVDLVSQWNKQNPGTDPPKLQVLDLIETFQMLIRPGGSDSMGLKNIVFMPNEQSLKTASGLRADKSNPTYSFDEMLMVAGKSSEK